MKDHRVARGLLSAVLLTAATAAAACGGGESGGGGGGAAFEPSRNVTMVVPYEAGGGSDVLGRTMASGLEDARKGVNIAVENRAGAGGAVGYSYLLEQAGNPHTLMASETAAVALPITTEAPFKWQDFTAIGMIAEDATLIVVPQDSPYKELADVIEGAKSEQVTVALSGATGLDAIVTNLMEKDQGVKFERVVFESGGEIVNAVLGGDADTAMLNPSEVIGQLRANKMRALAVFADQKYKGGRLADLPTAKEEGVDVSFTQYRGLLGTGGIKEPERKYWTDALTAWTEAPSYDKYIEDNYLIPIVRTGPEFESYLKEYEKQVQTAIGK